MEQPDEFHGVGGSYIVGKDGKRQRVEETKDAEPKAAERENRGPAAVKDQIQTKRGE